MRIKLRETNKEEENENMFFKKREKPFKEKSLNKNSKGDDIGDIKDLYVVAGLGNPGDKYVNTKHNVGFAAIELLAERHDVKLNKVKFKGLWGEGKIAGRKVILIKPQTFMNLSGESIKAISDWYKIPQERIIVVFDDIDISIGEVRIKRNGSAGTHNGMKSVIYKLGKDNFPRVKIGVGPKPEGWNLADYVLSKFTPKELETIEKSVERAALAVEEMIAKDIDIAMCKYNGLI